VFKKISRSITLVLLAISLAFPVLGQTESRIQLSTLDISEFPKITSHLDIRGQQGFFISGLPDDAATIFEDEQPLPGQILEVRPGAQIVVAYAGGESFGIFNLEAKTRYSIIQNWMVEWSTNQLEKDLDDLSLIIPEGVLVSHQTDPQSWTDGLLNYQPDFTLLARPLEILSAAIDTALDPIPAAGMGRTVIFLTEGIPDEQQAALQSQIDRASQGGTRVHIGYINSANLFESNQAIRMQDAARQTGGQYFAFSSNEPLPDLNLMVESSRRAYLLEYRSKINTPGQHSISVLINTDEGEIRSDSLTFEANLAPPIPVFVSPPTQVVRGIPPEMSPDLENLAPTVQTIEVLVEFPDGIQREISQLSLFISDTLLAEVNEPPFEQIAIDLSPFQTSEILLMRLEVTDELGLTGSSIETPLEIVVQPPETGLFPALGRNAPLIVAGVIGLSGIILFLVLVLAGRIRPRQVGERRSQRKAARDPVTQPIKTPKTETKANQPNVLERITKGLPSARIPWPSRSRPTTDPYGYLVQVTEDGQPKSETLFPITVSELTFGSDIRQAVIALDDPSVEPLHTRIWRDDQGTFHVEDSGTVAGTWLNYSTISPASSPLEHGDLIHIAKIGYRFTLSRPTTPRKPIITPLYEPNKETSEEGKNDPD
jgi:hypothetical protein